MFLNFLAVVAKFKGIQMLILRVYQSCPESDKRILHRDTFS